MAISLKREFPNSCSFLSFSHENLSYLKMIKEPVRYVHFE